jgi:hypothetical protein
MEHMCRGVYGCCPEKIESGLAGASGARPRQADQPAVQGRPSPARRATGMQDRAQLDIQVPERAQVERQSPLDRAERHLTVAIFWRERASG